MKKKKTVKNEYIVEKMRQKGMETYDRDLSIKEKINNMRTKTSKHFRSNKPMTSSYKKKRRKKKSITSKSVSLGYSAIRKLF